MKNDPTTKMYTELTGRERALLSFDHLTQGNVTEQERIEATMPMQYFTGLPLEYRSWTYNLQILAMLYAIEYWRNVATANTHLVGHNVIFEALVKKYPTNKERVQSSEWQEGKNLLKLFYKCEVMILSIEAAINELCEDHGINPIAIKRLTGEQCYTIIGTPPYEPDLQPNMAIVAGLREHWEGLLKSAI